MSELTGVSRETEEALRRYWNLLVEASAEQNLIAKSSLEGGWQRHIIDSAQLSPLIVGGDVVDVGSGAGLPGIVLSVLGHRVTLIEPRRRRSEFLGGVIRALSLTDAILICASAERVKTTFSTITARAVAPLDRLLGLTLHLARPGSRWVLLKGRSVQDELEVARAAWHGRFELIPSITDPAGMIVVAEDVRPRRRR